MHKNGEMEKRIRVTGSNGMLNTIQIPDGMQEVRSTGRDGSTEVVLKVGISPDDYPKMVCFSFPSGNTAMATPDEIIAAARYVILPDKLVTNFSSGGLSNESIKAIAAGLPKRHDSAPAATV